MAARISHLTDCSSSVNSSKILLSIVCVDRRGSINFYLNLKRKVYKMGKRRENGEGSIRLRKDGRWEGRYTVGSDTDTGKRISKSIMGKTEEEVQEKLRTAIISADITGGKYADKLTVSEWMTVWFETYSKPAIRPSTADSYYSFMKNHIFPNIGGMPISRLTSLNIQMMYNNMKESGRIRRSESITDLTLSNHTVRGVHMLLRQCLGQAVKERRLPYNPVDGCKPPPKVKSDIKVMPQEKIGVYLKTADQYGVLPMLFLELSSGLRRGELLALLWSDLDMDNLTISVTKQVSARKGELVVSLPKTQNSTRTVAISRQAAQLLANEHEKHPDNPYMFPSPTTGNMYYPDSVGRLHKKILMKAGMEKIRFHDLRHTFATLALQNGVDVKTLSSILGHYSAGFTLDTYAHVTQKMQRDAAKKVGKFMKQATAAHVECCSSV